MKDYTNLVGKWIFWAGTPTLVEAVEGDIAILNCNGRKHVWTLDENLQVISDEFVLKIAEATENRFILSKLNVQQPQKYVLITGYPAGYASYLTLGKTYKVVAETETSLAVAKEGYDNVGFSKSVDWYEFVPESFFSK